MKSLPLLLAKPSRSEGMGHCFLLPKHALGKLLVHWMVWLFWEIILYEILPVAVVMAWYKHKLLLGAAAQVRKFYYLHMRSSKMTAKTGPAKTGPARPLAMAMVPT